MADYTSLYFTYFNGTKLIQYDKSFQWTVFKNIFIQPYSCEPLCILCLSGHVFSPNNRMIYG